MASHPFHQKEYKNEDKCYIPYLDVKIGEQKISAIADTGCSPGMIIFRENVGECDLGKLISSQPVRITVADGHVIGADVYLQKIEIGGFEKEVQICVVDKKILDYKPQSVPPLLGRKFFEHIDILFKGKEKLICLYHPE